MRLDDQQRYLLSRIPSWYDVVKDEPKKPASVVVAEKVIARWLAACHRKEKTSKVAYNKAISETREVIYFKSPQDALKAVRRFETKFKRKEK